MKKSILILVLTGIVIINACTKKTVSTTTVTPVKATVTYAMNIKPLIATRCTPCHIPADGGFKTVLDNYDAAKQHIETIITRVQLPKGEKGYMPFKKEPLSPEDIALFKKWKEEGMAQ